MCENKIERERQHVCPLALSETVLFDEKNCMNLDEIDKERERVFGMR